MPGAVAITSVTVGELIGARNLPHGRRRESLLEAIEQTLLTGPGNVVPYDEAAARIYARLWEERKATGRPLGTEDGMIAATCLSIGATLATRNVADFAGLGLNLIDPWNQQQ